MTLHSTLPAAAQVQALIDQVQPASRIQVLSASHEKAFPKREPIDLYNVDLLCSGALRSTTLAVHHAPRARRVKALVKLAKAAERLARIDPGAIALYGEAREAEALLYAFPLDPKLSRLADAVSPKRVAERLGSVDGVQVEVVRYVPARRCQLRWRSAVGTVYAKLYQDARGEDVFRAMRWLHSRMAASGSERVSTPQPLAYWPDWNALAQQAAPGVTLHALCAGGQATTESFALAGEALAALHGSGPSAGTLERVHSPLDELDVAAHWARLAGDRHPVFRGLRGRLAPIAGAAHQGSSLATPVHRDCYDRQFLLDGSRVAVIDLDEISIGEPELDVANFLAHIELRAIQGIVTPEFTESFRAAFLAAYQRTGGRAPKPERLRFYLATSLIRLAALYSMRPGEARSSDRLLAEARKAASQAL